ncbi:MAG TPA: DUF308 domain-containing protein [Candidatus Elarobacter sp.]|jgi:uncharacterized membrane protein HdeD (DUF308 family)
MLERLVSHWWLFLIRGLLAIVFGVLLLVWPAAGLFTIAILFGAYAFVDGVFALVASFRMSHEGRRWIWLLLEGIVGIAAGIAAALLPAAAIFALTILLGAWAIITGVLAIASAMTIRAHVANEILAILLGLLSIVFGLVVFWLPAIGIIALLYTVSFYAILAGVLLIGLAFRLRRLNRAAAPA